MSTESLLEHHGWYEWICHTNFSFKYAASHPDEIMQRAHEQHYRGIAITDFDGVYGLARSWSAHKKLYKSTVEPPSLRLHYGAEVHLQADHHLPIILQDTLVLIATSALGYSNLCRILSYIHQRGKSNVYLSIAELSQQNLTDLVAIQPMRGLVFRQTSHNTQHLDHYSMRMEIFGRENFYAAIARQLSSAEDWIIPSVLDTAKQLNIKTLLSQDVFFHQKQEKIICDIMHCTRLNKPLQEAGAHLFVNAERRLRSLQEIETKFRSIPIFLASLKNSVALAERCDFNLGSLRYHYPKEMIPEGMSPQQFLQDLVWEAAKNHYQPQIPEHLTKLLQHELNLIQHLGFADYFLTVWDIVWWARGRGILCQGRGSAANSAVCFVLGITAVNPAQFDVLFERFISVERGDPPDIDVDFEHERREEVIQYIYERYGRKRAAMVANVICLQRRGSLRTVGKALGFSEEILTDPETHQSTIGEDRFKLWKDLASKLRGYPSHLGIHSGGFIISEHDLTQLVALEPATMPGRSVVQWCKEDIEALGFFKIDILALGILSAMRKCMDDIATHYQVKLTLNSIPPNDTPTYDMICKAATIGTFQIESRAQMSMLPRLKPRCFYDLVIEVAIIRPGPIQGGMIHPYLRRRNGLEAISFPDPRLKPILQRTLGIPIFQEQIMRIAMAVGGFNASEANELRRNMGAFSIKGDVGKWVGKFTDGMKANGLPEEFVETILKQIQGFSSYGFPESHAASFALLAYASCYLKKHFPAAFYCSILNSQPMGFYSPHVLLQSAKYDGVEILPVCVQMSALDSTLETTPDGKIAIRQGLRFINRLSSTAMHSLANNTSRKDWKNITDFLQACAMQRIDITALAAANALLCFGITRRDAIWRSEAAPFHHKLEDEESYFCFDPESPHQYAASDFASTGTSLGLHPCSIIKEHEWCYPVPLHKIVSASEIKTKCAPKSLCCVFGMIIVRQKPPSAKGMVFMTLEDETGWINIVITPDFFGKHGQFLTRSNFICVAGVMQKNGDAQSIRITQVFMPKEEDDKQNQNKNPHVPARNLAPNSHSWY